MDKARLARILGKGTFGAATVSALTVGSVALSNQASNSIVLEKLEKADEITEQKIKNANDLGIASAKAAGEEVARSAIDYMMRDFNPGNEMMNQIKKNAETGERLTKMMGDMNTVNDNLIKKQNEESKRTNSIESKLSALDGKVSGYEQKNAEHLDEIDEELEKLRADQGSTSELLNKNAEETSKNLKNLEGWISALKDKSKFDYDKLDGDISLLQSRVAGFYEGAQHDINTLYEHMNSSEQRLDDIEEEVSGLKVDHGHALRLLDKSAEETRKKVEMNSLDISFNQDQIGRNRSVIMDMDKKLGQQNKRAMDAEDSNKKRFDEIAQAMDKQDSKIEANRKSLSNRLTGQWKTLLQHTKEIRQLGEKLNQYGVNLESVKNKAAQYWSNLTGSFGQLANMIADNKDLIESNQKRIEQVESDASSVWSNLYDYFTEFAEFKKEVKSKSISH